MKLLAVLFILLSFEQSLAQSELNVIPIGEATEESERLVIAQVESAVKLTPSSSKMMDEVMELLRNDFAFYQKYFAVNYLKEPMLFDTPRFDELNTKGVSYVITAKVELLATSQKPNEESLRVTFKAYKVKTKNEIFQETVVFEATKKNLRSLGHKVANQLFRQFTGKDAMFESRIVFVSDRDSKGRDRIKELYVMDFDGRNLEQLTHHQSIVISPSMSHDGKKVLYSVMRKHGNIKNIDLVLMDIERKTTKVISDRAGLNSGAVFSHDGEHVYLSLSFTGNVDIYRMHLATKELKRLTYHASDDVDPTITSDGSLMSFLSGRAGRSMIYTMSPQELSDGKEASVKRITFTGQFNATPRFSPDGKNIVFSSWVDRGFDIYRLDSSGQNLVRLTKDYGTNEDPSFSPDNEFLVFSHQKRGVQNLVIMDRDGEILGSVTNNLGSCSSPRWSR